MEGLSDIDVAEMRRYRDDTAISAVTHELFTVAKGEYNQNEKDLLDRPSIIYLWGKNIKQQSLKKELKSGYEKQKMERRLKWKKRKP